MVRRTFRLKVLLYFVPLILGLVVLSCVLIYQLERQNLEKRTKQMIQDNVSARASELGEWLKGLRLTAELLAQLPQVRSLDPLQFSPLLDRLIHEQTIQSVTVFVSDAKGNATAQGNRQVNISQREYFKTLMTDMSTTTIISGPVISLVTRETVFAVASVILDDQGARIGVVGFSVLLDTLGAKVQNIAQSKTSFGWVVDEKGLLLVHPNPSFVLKFNIFNASSMGYERITQDSPDFRIQNSGSASYRVPKNGSYDEKVFVWMRIPESPGWILGISMPVEEVYRGTTELVEILIFTCVLITLLLLALLLALSRRVDRPLQALMKGIQDFESRHQAMDVQIRTGDEFESLARSFNLMTQTINRYTAGMELAIAHKTQELQEANHALVDKNSQLEVLNRELARTNVHLRELSSRDELTGLYNRFEFNRRYPDFLKTARRKGRNLCVLMLDLDNFKQYNDLFGHGCGDRILQAVGAIFTDETRDIDFVARYGGDEFVMILEESLEATLGIAHRILGTFELSQGFPGIVAQFAEVPALSHDKWLSCCIGVVEYTRALYSLSPEEVLALADQALYRGKREGKHAVRVYGTGA